MAQFLSRRLVLLLPVMLGILLITFAIVHLIPGDPCVAMLGERATPAACNAFKERYGMNDNIVVQFERYVVNIAQGDFGMSLRFGRPVVDLISERLPMTVELTIGAMLFSTIVGVSLGIISALRRNSWIDTITMIVANLGVSMPVFWLGLLLAYFFAIILKGTPVSLPPSARFTAGMGLDSLIQVWQLQKVAGLEKFFLDFISNISLINAIFTGNWSTFFDGLRHLILPSIAVGTIPMATIARIIRSSILEVLGQDYVRTARAKGMRESMVISKHVMRNALIPIITIIGIETGALLSGAVLTETVFSLPGVGTALVNAILARDYPVVQGFTMVIALVFVFVNLVVDASYAFLDPRIRLN